MDMKLNTQLLVEYRNRKAWSQQQLADVSGLSLRTVQRIENTGKASPESTKALASIFGKDIEDLFVLNIEPKTKAFNISETVTKSIAFSSLIIASILFFSSTRIVADSGQFRFSGVVKIDNEPSSVFGIELPKRHTQLSDIDANYQLLFITPDSTNSSSKTELRLLKIMGSSSKILRKATVTGSNSDIRYFSYQICSGKITFYNYYKNEFNKCKKTK